MISCAYCSESCPNQGDFQLAKVDPGWPRLTQVGPWLTPGWPLVDPWVLPAAGHEYWTAVTELKSEKIYKSCKKRRLSIIIFIRKNEQTKENNSVTNKN